MDSNGEQMGSPGPLKQYSRRVERCAELFALYVKQGWRKISTNIILLYGSGSQWKHLVRWLDEIENDCSSWIVLHGIQIFLDSLPSMLSCRKVLALRHTESEFTAKADSVPNVGFSATSSTSCSGRRRRGVVGVAVPHTLQQVQCAAWQVLRARVAHESQVLLIARDDHLSNNHPTVITC